MSLSRRRSLISLGAIVLIIALKAFNCCFLHARYLVGNAAGLPGLRPSAARWLTSSDNSRVVLLRAARDLDGRVTSTGGNFKINEQIRSREVRVIGMVKDDTEGGGAIMEDMSEVMLTTDALELAKSKGVDLILINEDKDPPLVKIANVGKYAYQEQKKQKEQTKNTKQPKVKEVKLTYTTGEHDIQTRVRACQKWLANPRQQVKFTVVMKGRTKMFEKQGRELLERVRREAAGFGKVPGADKGQPTVTKDGRGDLVMLLNHGADRPLLKQILEEAGMDKAAIKAAITKTEAEEAAAAASADDDEEEEDGSAEGDDEDGESSDEPDEADEVKALELELEQVTKELLDCGVKKSELGSQDEVKDLNARISKAKAKAGKLAFADSRYTLQWSLAAAVFVGGARGAQFFSFSRR